MNNNINTNTDRISPIKALPLSLQHVVAMVVGCVTVPTIVSNAAGMSGGEQVIMMQASLFCAAIAIFIQNFNMKGLIGSGLPVIVGSGFAFISTMVNIAGNSEMGISYVLGAQLIGAVVGIFFGLIFKKIRFLFAPVVTASVVITIGISLYKTAIGYMAGGKGSADFGSWQNWVVALFTLAMTLILSNFCKGVLKVASTLVGLILGYLFALPMGMINFDKVATASLFQLPKPLHFGLDFSLAAIIPMSIIFMISAIQDMGQFEATASAVHKRRATDQEITGGVIGNNIASFIGAFLGGTPSATAGQNVGIVVTTGVIDKIVFYLAAGVVMITALIPKLAALFLTIPAPVLGGATIAVFGSIAMTGIRMLANDGLSQRNTTIAGLSIAMAVGLSYYQDALSGLPSVIQMIFGGSEIVIVAIVAIILNLILPKEKENK